MSVGYFVQRAGAELVEDDLPLDLSKPLSVSERLAIVGQQIINYSREADDDLLRVAASLID
jgi:hypothetical protein